MCLAELSAVEQVPRQQRQQECDERAARVGPEHGLVHRGLGVLDERVDLLGGALDLVLEICSKRRCDLEIDTVLYGVIK